MQQLLLGVVLVLTIAWLVIRIRRNKAEDATHIRQVSEKVYKGRYHAVSLSYSGDCCDAAKAATGHRYLAAEAPKLPLPGCDGRQCHCKYAHHEDRRSGQDRRSPFGSGGYNSSTGRFAKERRSGIERRKKPTA